MLRPTLFAVIGLLLCLVPAVKADLKWEKPWQEFHRLPSDGHVEAKYTFRNEGKKPVTIRKVKTSCGCTSAKLAKDTYAPGEQGEVAVRFTFGDRTGAHRKVITVTSDDQPEPTELNIVVWIDEPLKLTPTLVYWKTGEAPAPKTVQITGDGKTPVRIKSVASSNPRLAARLEKSKDDDTYTVTITPADTGSKASADIVLETDFPADQPRSYTIFARIK